MKTVRLIYPQWQGADIVRLVPEVKDPADAARGYYLGARLLDFLAPAAEGETLTVPVDTAMTARTVQDGVIDRDIIFRQTQAALAMLRAAAPDRIVTLGGECSGYMCVFAYAVSLITYQLGGLITGETAFGVGTVAALLVLAFLIYMLVRPNQYNADYKRGGAASGKLNGKINV